MDYRPDFLITPGVIAYDEGITYGGERLYSIIYWLHSLALGECIASNETLAEYMGKKTSAKYVGVLLKSLEDKGYIQRFYSDDTKMTRTRITPLVNYATPSIKIRVPPPSKLCHPLHENYGHISNIYKEDILVKDISILPIKFGKTPLSRLKTIYEKLYLDEFQVLPRVFLNGKDGGVLKSLLKEYSEVQITVLMITHFNWFGADGKSDWDHAKLEKAAFPLTWISPNLNPYINYINGSYKVEFTNEDAVLKFVRDYLKKLSTD